MKCISKLTAYRRYIKFYKGVPRIYKSVTILLKKCFILLLKNSFIQSLKILIKQFHSESKENILRPSCSYKMKVFAVQQIKDLRS